MAADDADLGGFLKAAGESLAGAQSGLGPESTDVPISVAISEAELEVKATLDRGSDGTVRLRPVSAADARAGVPVGALSTLRVRYVAMASESLHEPVQTPARAPEDVIAEVSGRPDVASLDKILGGLAYDAVFVRDSRRWLVSAHDPDGNLVREVVVPDSAKG